jgi:hypothetical protein
MLSGRVKHLIDTVVDESIPHRWLHADDESGEDLEDLMGMDPIRLLDSPHLLKIVKDAVAHLEPRWGNRLPASTKGFHQWLMGSASERALLTDVIQAYDTVVDYIMVWSKKKGYDTCKGCMPYEEDEDIDPFKFSILDQDLLNDFYYLVRDRGFYLAVSRWVAKKFLSLGIIDSDSVQMFVERAEAQP